MNIGRAVWNELRKLFGAPAPRPAPVHAREWVDRTRCW